MIWGRSANQASGNGIVGGNGQCKITNVYLSDVKGSGIKLTGNPSDTSLYQIRAEACNIGVEFDSPNGGFLVDGLYVKGCLTAGVKIASTWVNIGNFRITGCIGDGVLISAPTGGNAWHIVLDDGDVDGCQKSNIKLYADVGGIYGVDIANITFGDASITHDNTYPSIYCLHNAHAVTGLNIHDDYFYEPYAEYIFFCDGGYPIGTFHNNYIGLAGHAVAYFGTSMKAYRNYGYISENSGTATMLINNGSIVVNHGLATTPTRVQVTATSNPGLADSFWADTYGATSFTIHATTNVTSATTFDWRAVIGEGN